MKNRLTLTLPHFNGETATSFTSRLAARNGATSPNVFCEDVGLNWQAIIRGDETAFDQLADLSSASLTSLKRASPIIAITGRRYYLNNQVTSILTMNRRRLRICPQCILDGLAQHGEYGAAGKLIWELAPIKACLTHGLPLIELVSASSLGYKFDFAQCIHKHRQRIEELARDVESVKPSNFNRYLCDRVDGKHNYPWLDQLEFHVAVRLCEVFGVALAYGPSVKMNSLSESDVAAAAEDGFQAIKDGADHFMDALRSLRSSRRRASHAHDIFALYGWLNSRHTSPEYKSLRQIVHRFILENYPVAPGTFIFGKSCPARLRYTIDNASREYGVPSKRLAYRLLKLGLATENPKTERIELTSHLTAAKAETICREIADLIGSLAAGRILGISRSVMQRFLKRNLVKPKLDPFSRAPKFARQDIEDLVKDLRDRSQPVNEAVLPMRTVANASAQLKCESAEIVQLIIQKKIHTVGWINDKSGIPAIVVDPEEVRPLLSNFRPVGPNRSEAAAFLRTNLPTIKFLLDEGYLTGVLRRSDKTRYRSTFIKQADLNSFSRRYVTLGVLARELDRQAGPLAIHLEARSIPHVVGPKPSSRIYRRRDLPNDLIADDCL